MIFIQRCVMITKENSCFLVLDMQSKLFPHIYDFHGLEITSLKIIEGMKNLNIPILVTEQYPKGIGATIPSVQTALDEDYKPIEKLTFSCCGEEQFLHKLKSLGKKNVIIIGIESHICVLQTCLELIEYGYQPVLVDECISSRKLNDKTVAIQRMRQSGAIITTYESILFELCRISGTPVFKEISKIVK